MRNRSMEYTISRTDCGLNGSPHVQPRIIFPSSADRQCDLDDSDDHCKDREREEQHQNGFVPAAYLNIPEDFERNRQD